MNEVRPQTFARTPIQRGADELVDELAHVHGGVTFEPRGPELPEVVEEEVVDQDGRGGPARREVDGEARGEGQEGGDGGAEQFVFVDGRPVLVSGRLPVGDGAFDPRAVQAGFRGGGLDLVADGGVSRMVFNGRLRLSGLSARAARRAAAALVSDRPEAPEPPPRLPPGPLSLRFDLGAAEVPLLTEDAALEGVTYAQAERRMRQAVEAGDLGAFSQMNAELAAVWDLLRSVAEIHPDLSFEAFKLLFADLVTPAFARRLPDLVGADGRVDAARWARGWQRLDAQGDTKGRDAIGRLSEAQVRFLGTGLDGRSPNLEAGAAAVGAFVREHVTAAALFEHAQRHRAHIASALSKDIPRNLAFVGDPAYGAAVLGLAQRARRGDSEPWSTRVLDRVRLGEDAACPGLETTEGARIDLDAWRRRFGGEGAGGLLDALAATCPTGRAQVDPLAAAVHAELEPEAGPERYAAAVWGGPAKSARLDPRDGRARATVAAAEGLLVVGEGETLPAAAWGSPILFGAPVRPEDLEAATAQTRDALIRGATLLANALERAGCPADEVDVLVALKSRANRGGGEDVAVLRGEMLDLLHQHLRIAPLGTTGAVDGVLVVTVDRGGEVALRSAASPHIEEFVTLHRR